MVEDSKSKEVVGTLDRCMDWLVTLLCWAWFTCGFILFYSWRYLFCYLFVKNSESYFQRMNCTFYRIFFRIIQVTSPLQKIEISTEVGDIQSGVVVSNHLSYLDPLLLISVYQQHKTIVKARFFSMPIFGWFITRAGYIPSTSDGRNTSLMLEQMESLPDFFQAGGNLFVFPEGTRSRDGKIGALHKGAMKLARLHKVPIYVVQISNTDKLFTPGKFVFNTRRENTIRVDLLERIEPDYHSAPPSTSQLEQRVRHAFSARAR